MIPAYILTLLTKCWHQHPSSDIKKLATDQFIHYIVTPFPLYNKPTPALLKTRWGFIINHSGSFCAWNTLVFYGIVYSKSPALLSNTTNWKSKFPSPIKDR